MRAPLRLTNTHSKTLEEFQPLSPDGPVRLYSCGPTVYSFAHIGNFRSFLTADLLRRVLERTGRPVRHVMNITDVGHMTQDHLADAHGEDKLAKAARELGWDPYHVAQHFLTAFEVDAKALRLRNYSGAEAADPTLHPRATRYIPEMLALIQKLLERNHAYADSTGQVYFSIESFPQYGQLSGKVLEELEAGARVEVREEKRDPRDFALWKVDSKHLMQWDPHSSEGWPPEDWQRLQRLVPGGLDARVKKGFPGWHIECSAMSLACLGETIDLHTGGEDNIFPHHECEIAQSCCALGTTVPGPDGPRVTFSRFWVHAKHLMVENRKMSKRDGTFFTVRDLLDPVAAGRGDLGERLVAAGFEGGKVTAPVLRLGLLWSHYRAPLNFSFDLLTQARNAVVRLQSLYERASGLSGAGAVSPAVQAAIDAGLTAYDEALADDLNMERAMAAVLELISKLNQVELAPADGPAVAAALESLDQILDVLVRRRMGLVEKAQLAAAEVSAEESAAAQAAAAGELDDQLIERLVLARQAAKKRKDFAGADAIRALLKERGVVLEDLPHGRALEDLSRAQMLRAHAIALAALMALAAPARSATFEGFDDFVARLQSAAPPARAELIRDYLAWQRARGGFPVIEKDAVVFVHAGAGAEKAVRVVGEFKLRNFNSILWDEQGEPLAAAGGIFYRRMRFESDARLQYQFVVDGKFVNDALNPRTFISGAAPGAGKDGISVSDLIMPAYRLSELAVPRAEAATGRTVTLDEPWAVPRVSIHLPVGYDPAKRYPAVYVADGWAWVRIAGLPTIVDNLIADSAIEPVITVFIDPTDDRSGWYQFRSPYVAYLEKVIGWVDGHFSTRPGASGRLHVGSSAGGRAGLAVVLERPDLFANTALFSPSLFTPLHYLEPYLSGRKRPDRRLRVWLSAGTYEGYIHPDALVLERYLKARGIALATAYTHEGHSMAAYRNLAGEMLRFFFARSAQVGRRKD